MKLAKYLLLVIILFGLTVPVSAQKIIPYKQKVFTFGHVGIDFMIKHKFIYFNETDQPINILDANASCDCSIVKFKDSVILPGDTAYFDLSFETGDYYGATNKSFLVKTDNPDHTEIKYHYVSIVGQWYHGLKPIPSSFLFLPGKELNPVKIANLKFDKIEIVEYFKYDNSFEVTPIKESAGEKEFLEFEIIPSSEMKKGTIKTTLTVSIKKSGVDELAYLTIPIKIVKY